MLLEDLRDLIRIRITDKKRAYGFAFNKENVAAQAVLADLAQYCRANSTTYSTDAREHAFREGRKDVWHRIQKYMNLSEFEIDRLVERALQERKL